MASDNKGTTSNKKGMIAEGFLMGGDSWGMRAVEYVMKGFDKNVNL